MTYVKLKLKASDLKDGYKPYMLFCGRSCYPSGGWQDFKGYFSSIANAKLWLQKSVPDAYNKWAHIVYNHKIILWASCPINQWVKEDGIWEWRTEE